MQSAREMYDQRRHAEEFVEARLRAAGISVGGEFQDADGWAMRAVIVSAAGGWAGRRLQQRARRALDKYSRRRFASASRAMNDPALSSDKSDELRTARGRAAQAIADLTGESVSVPDPDVNVTIVTDLITGESVSLQAPPKLIVADSLSGTGDLSILRRLAGPECAAEAARLRSIVGDDVPPWPADTRGM